MHGTKHRTIDPGCLENPRPEGAEPGERCFSIFFSSPNNLFLRKAVGYSAFTCTSKYPIPPSQRQNMWKTRRKNRKECEKVPAIFVRKSTENFVTRYTHIRRPFMKKSWLCTITILVATCSATAPSIPQQCCPVKSRIESAD